MKRKRSDSIGFNGLGFFKPLPNDVKWEIFKRLDSQNINDLNLLSTDFKNFMSLSSGPLFKYLIARDISTNPTKSDNETDVIFYKVAFANFAKLLALNEEIVLKKMTIFTKELIADLRSSLLSLVKRNCNLLIREWFEKCHEGILRSFNKYPVDITIAMHQAIRDKNFETLLVLKEGAKNISSKYALLQNKKEDVLFNKIIRALITSLLPNIEKAKSFTTSNQEDLNFLFKCFSSNQEKIAIEPWLILTKPFKKMGQVLIITQTPVPGYLTIEMFEKLFELNNQNTLAYRRN